MGRDVVLPSRWSRSSASSKSALAALSSEEAGSGKEAFQVTPLQKCSVPGPSTEHCTCAAGAAAEVLPSTTSRQAAARNRGRCCIFAAKSIKKATEGVDVAPPSAPHPCPPIGPAHHVSRDLLRDRLHPICCLYSLFRARCCSGRRWHRCGRFRSSSSSAPELALSCRLAASSSPEVLLEWDTLTPMRCVSPPSS